MVEVQELRLRQREQALATSSHRMSDLKLVFGGLWNAALRRPEAVSPVSPPTAPEESSRDRSGVGEICRFFMFWLRAASSVGYSRSAVVKFPKTIQLFLISPFK